MNVEQADMIQPLVDNFMSRKGMIEAELRIRHPSDYTDLVRLVVRTVADENNELDPDRVHEINDGDYQGTLVYVIGEKGYQPSDYWYVKVGYGSCSGCDTLEAIRNYDDENYDDEQPKDEQVRDYLELCLHIVQGLKKMGSDIA